MCLTYKALWDPMGKRDALEPGLRTVWTVLFHGAACEWNNDTSTASYNQSALGESLHSTVLILGCTPLWSVPSLRLTVFESHLSFVLNWSFPSLLHLPIKYLSFLCDGTAFCSPPTAPSRHPEPTPAAFLTFPVQPHLFWSKLCWWHPPASLLLLPQFNSTEVKPLILGSLRNSPAFFTASVHSYHFVLTLLLNTPAPMLQQQSHAKVTCGFLSLLWTCNKLLTDRNQEKTQSLQLVRTKGKWTSISSLPLPALFFLEPDWDAPVEVCNSFHLESHWKGLENKIYLLWAEQIWLWNCRVFELGFVAYMPEKSNLCEHCSPDNKASK